MTDGIGEKVNVTKVGSDGGRIKEVMRPLGQQSDTISKIQEKKETREDHRKEFWGEEGGGGEAQREIKGVEALVIRS